MKQTGKRIMAFLAAICICVIQVINYGNVVLAGSYESEEVVVETENWIQNGKALINGIVKEEGIISDIQAGIVRSLDD